MSQAEQHFVTLALTAWRALNSERQKKLRTSLKPIKDVLQ